MKTEKFNYIYLCIYSNYNYNCIKFNSYYDADNHCNKYYSKNLNTTMIPVCKYTPSFLHKYIINYKLKKIYNVKII